jgi:predicted RNA-binding protein YlxR (DUF448 family)
MLRLVLGPDQIPFVDLLGRAPGRGVYVEAERAVLAEALSKKGLGRTFKGLAKELSPEEVEALIEGTVARLEDRVLELMTLARRAGVAELGRDASFRLFAQDREGTVAIIAKDISARSEGDVAGAVSPKIAVVQAGDKATIGARLGREDVGVVGIAPSVLSERIRIEGARLSGLRMSSTNPVPRGRVRRLSEDQD